MFLREQDSCLQFCFGFVLSFAESSGYVFLQSKVFEMYWCAIFF